jgi:hypothetical protein
MIQILEEPVGHTYKQLIKLAFSICDQFILVERDQLAVNENGKQLIADLTPYVKVIKKQDNWPGTQLLGHEADVYYFDCEPELEQLVLERADRLYQWVCPEKLEDLCFFKQGKPWLVTSAHEQIGWIKTTEWEEILRLREVEGLMIY